MAISKQGDTLQGVALTRGNTYVTNTDGVKKDGVFIKPTIIECVLDGDIAITWYKDAPEQTISMKANKQNPIICHSVRIVSGTFNIGYD